MAISSQLLTVEEFRKLPPDDGPVYHELRDGEVAAVTRPKLNHTLLQRRLHDLLLPLAPSGSYVEVELAFRAVPEYDLRVADVAYISPERFAAADPEDNIRGAPDLVIEVLSPSNTVGEIYDKEDLCLKNGALEFWTPDRRQIKVSKPDGSTVTYKSGHQIPLFLFGHTSLDVDAIFN